MEGASESAYLAPEARARISATSSSPLPRADAPCTGSERFRRFSYGDLVQRDKASLDLVRLRDETLEDMENLPPPDVIAQEIVEDLEAALAEFAAIARSLAPPADDDR